MIIPALVGLVGSVCLLTGPPSGKDLSQDAEALRRELGVPGLAIAVTDDTRTIAWGVAGVRSAEAEAPIEPSDRFHIGSLTKSMTATVVARLIERGLLDWETTVTQADPALAADIPARSGTITMAQLLSHRSGLPDDRRDAASIMQMWGLEGDQMVQRAKAARFLLARDTLTEPGERFAYANANYIVAGHVLQRITGLVWEDLIRDELFVPLGMGSAGQGPPGMGGEPLSEPLGHAWDGQAYRPIPAVLGADNPPALGPAGRVHASVGDLATYVRAHLGGLRGQDGILRAETFALLHHDTDADGYAMGWGVSGEGPDRVSSHAGSNTRWLAQMFVLPERNLGIVVVMNGLPMVEPPVDVASRIRAVLVNADLIPSTLESESP